MGGNCECRMSIYEGGEEGADVRNTKYEMRNAKCEMRMEESRNGEREVNCGSSGRLIQPVEESLVRKMLWNSEKGCAVQELFVTFVQVR